MFMAGLYGRKPRRTRLRDGGLVAVVVGAAPIAIATARQFIGLQLPACLAGISSSAILGRLDRPNADFRGAVNFVLTAFSEVPFILREPGRGSGTVLTC